MNRTLVTLAAVMMATTTIALFAIQRGGRGGPGGALPSYSQTAPLRSVL